MVLMMGASGLPLASSRIFWRTKLSASRKVYPKGASMVLSPSALSWEGFSWTR